MATGAETAADPTTATAEFIQQTGAERKPPQVAPAADKMSWLRQQKVPLKA